MFQSCLGNSGDCGVAINQAGAAHFNNESCHCDAGPGMCTIFYLWHPSALKVIKLLTKGCLTAFPADRSLPIQVTASLLYPVSASGWSHVGCNVHVLGVGEKKVRHEFQFCFWKKETSGISGFNKSGGARERIKMIRLPALA